jgi:hypothetical protein
MKVITQQELKQLSEAFSIGVRWFEALSVSVPEEEHQKFDDAFGKVVEIQHYREDAEEDLNRDSRMGRGR